MGGMGLIGPIGPIGRMGDGVREGLNSWAARQRRPTKNEDPQE